MEARRLSEVSKNKPKEPNSVQVLDKNGKKVYDSRRSSVKYLARAIDTDT